MPIIQTEAEINGSLTYSLQEIGSSWHVGYDSAASMLVFTPEAAATNELGIDRPDVFTMPVYRPATHSPPQPATHFPPHSPSPPRQPPQVYYPLPPPPNPPSIPPPPFCLTLLLGWHPTLCSHAQEPPLSNTPSLPPPPHPTPPHIHPSMIPLHNGRTQGALLRMGGQFLKAECAEVDENNRKASTNPALLPVLLSRSQGPRPKPHPPTITTPHRRHHHHHHAASARPR